jgi:hypothetical protein
MLFSLDSCRQNDASGKNNAASASRQVVYLLNFIAATCWKYTYGCQQTCHQGPIKLKPAISQDPGIIKEGNREPIRKPGLNSKFEATVKQHFKAVLFDYLNP